MLDMMNATDTGAGKMTYQDKRTTKTIFRVYAQYKNRWEINRELGTEKQARAHIAICQDYWKTNKIPFRLAKMETVSLTTILLQEPPDND